MWAKEELLAKMARIIDLAHEAGTKCEVLFMATKENNIRSALGEAHQAFDIEPMQFCLRLRRGNRYINVNLPGSSLREARRLIQQNAAALEYLEPTEYLPGLVSQPQRLPEVIYELQESPSQDFHDPEWKVRAFQKFQKINSGWETSGRFYTITTQTAVMNSLGLARYHTTSYCGISLTASKLRRGGQQRTAYAYQCGLSPQELDVGSVIAEVLERAARLDELPVVDFLRGKLSRESDAILSPYAVRTLIQEVLRLTFTGHLVENGESFLSGKRSGCRIANRRLTMTDDWKFPGVVRVPFDFEGRTRQRVPLIEQGHFGRPTFDSMAAKMAKRRSTGHSGGELGSGRPECVVIDGGAYTHDSLVAQSDQPTVVVSGLHYPTLTYEKKAVFSADTNHGTFLVEGGKWRGIIETPLRVRMKAFDAFKRIDGLTGAVPLFDDEDDGMEFPATYIVPSMRIRSAISFLHSAS